jgi:3-keto-5-aminohexanoate cleavage enzyme
MYIKGQLAKKLIIQLAPTGIIPTKKDNPHVPLTPPEIAEDTYKAYQLGASIVHVHARDVNGDATSSKEVYREIFALIRKKCPDIIINATLSRRASRVLENRVEVLDLEPEMATFTPGNVNFVNKPSLTSMQDMQGIAKILLSKKIKPEIEIFEPGFINTAKYLMAKGFLKPPLHFNFMLGSLGSIPADIKDLLYLISNVDENCTWGAGGIGRFQAQINIATVLLGNVVRVGIEDAIYYLHEKKQFATNEELVRRVRMVAELAGREIATPSEAREILGLQ